MRALSLYNITTYGSSFQLLQSLGAFPNLTTLYLNYNDFRGRILGDGKLYHIYSAVYIFRINSKIQFATFKQTGLQNLSSLKELYLDGCSLDEHALQSLGALHSLKNLSLQELNGTVLSGGKLTNFNSTITYH